MARSRSARSTRARSLLVALGAVALGVLFVVGLLLQFDLTIRGTTVDGEVRVHSVVPGLTGDDDTYLLRYRFVDATGRTFAAQAMVDHATWATLADGDSVAVTYLPENPNVNRLAIRWTDLLGPLAAIGLAGAVVVMVVVIRVFRWLRPASLRQPSRRRRRP